jgi:hypothetical protein
VTPGITFSLMFLITSAPIACVALVRISSVLCVVASRFSRVSKKLFRGRNHLFLDHSPGLVDSVR